MKKIMMLLIASSLLYTSCTKEKEQATDLQKSFTTLQDEAGDLAVQWNKLQMDLSRNATGFGPGPATRAFAYSGLVLYESMVEGMSTYQSLAPGLMGKSITGRNGQVIYWPASGNAAMATILRNQIPTNKLSKIDSLESLFKAQFADKAPADVLEQSARYGRLIANSIFDWSKSDGFAEALDKNNSYVVPVGPGLWEPTPPANAIPINVYMGEIRTFVPNSPTLTMAPEPTAFSPDNGSDFYKMVNDVYTLSQSLSSNDVVTVKTWGEVPGNYVNALRYIQIAIQLAGDKQLKLDEAAAVFAQHNMALQEAVACVFKSKYKYNLVRPITYVRSTMGFSTWNTVIATPAHPEYPAAHATLGRSSSRILETHLGVNFSFTDKTHEKTWGARTYNTLKAYSDEAGWSRVLGGIHYKPSVDAGAVQGEKVADLILGLPFKK